MVGRGNEISPNRRARGVNQTKGRDSMQKRGEDEGKHQHQPGNSHPHPQSPPYVSNFVQGRLRLYVPSPLRFVLHARVGQFSPQVHDLYRWVVSSVIYRTHVVRAADERGYVPLHWETLGSIIGRHKLTKVLDDLVAWGVLDRSNSYQVGKRSVGYRLNHSFASTKVRLEWAKNHKLAAKVGRNTGKLEGVRNKLEPAYQLVYESSKRVRINGAKARHEAYKVHGSGTAACVARRIAIDALENGNYYFLVEPRSKRAYHNVCNLASDLRRYLTIDDQTLGQVDIASSQPLLLWLQLAENPYVDPAEIELMKTSLVRGTFYENIKVHGMPREQLKKLFFRDVAYSKRTYSTPVNEMFKSKFPTFYQAITVLRRGDHTRLPIAMQEAEACIIFKAVARFAKVTGGQVPILTIHDSLVTTTGYLELAKHVLLEVFQEMHGIQPLLRVKLFADDRRKSA